MRISRQLRPTGWQGKARITAVTAGLGTRGTGRWNKAVSSRWREEDGTPVYDACPPGKYNIRRCECCGCPHCGAKSIRFRKNEEPDYACGNPNCTAEFSHPVERPFDPDMGDAREMLYWECKNRGEPTLAPFKGHS